MVGEIKHIMIRQCSPVLMGKKPAALFPLRSADCLHCLSVLLPHHIDLLILRETISPAGTGEPVLASRPLVLLYDESMLEETLSNAAIRRFLLGLGYPAAASIPRVLEYLKVRFTGGETRASCPE